MNLSSSRLPGVVIAVCIAAAAATCARCAPQAIEIDLAAPASQLAPALTPADATALQGVKKLVITNFRVVLISESDATGTASAGLGAIGTASQTTVYTLGNLDRVKLEAMANAAHVSWQHALRAAGYDVLPTSILHGKPGADRLGASSTLEHFQMIEMGGNIAMMITPGEVPIKAPLGAFPTDAHGRKIESAIATGGDAAKIASATGKGGMLGKFGSLGGKAVGLAKTAKGMGSVTGAIGDAGAISKLSESLGAALVEVTVLINFVDLQASGGGFLERLAGSDSASVTGTVQPTFVATETKMNLINGNKLGSITLNRPVVLSGEAFSEVRNATTAMDTAGNISGAVISSAVALQNGTGVHSSTLNRREAVASANYGEVVAANLDLLGKAMAEAMPSP